MKRAFLDTNILLEVLLGRRESVQCSEILQAGVDGEVVLCASMLTFANVAYVLKQQKISREDLYKAMRYMEQMIQVLPMEPEQLHETLLHEVRDFEDMLQYQCAVAAGCDCLVTINIRDFVPYCTLPLYTPDDFLDELDKQ